MPQFSADHILEMLKQKHLEDVFVPECKDGSSGMGYLRLDAWVMKKSWVHPLAIGYEIKVSRSDFVNDEKWRGYLPYCNEFYFVCPTGLISPDELPNDTGLLWLAKTGTRLFKKKKPVYRNDTPDMLELYKYIVMCRSKIKRNTYDSDQTRKEYWKQWLAEKDEKKTIGYNVSKKIKQLVSTRITEVECKQRWLESENKKLAYLGDEMKKLGFDSVPSEWEVDGKLRDLNSKVPRDFLRNLEQLKKHLDTAIAALSPKVDEND